MSLAMPKNCAIRFVDRFGVLDDLDIRVAEPRCLFACEPAITLGKITMALLEWLVVQEADRSNDFASLLCS